ncbi:hypothetical protein ACTWQL_21880 [Pseudalkalibacillus sp. R45]|uniref:hypothetical protein n=1 Tax=Pseudalkalibacillus sp. R45 TaxID=3457433 RepID=UPI003FCD6A6D
MNAALALDEFMSKTNFNSKIENETLLLTAYQLVKEVKSNYSIKSVRIAQSLRLSMG